MRNFVIFSVVFSVLTVLGVTSFGKEIEETAMPYFCDPNDESLPDECHHY